MPTFCSNCGAALADGSKFCNSCGKPTSGAGPAAFASAVEQVPPRIRTSIPDFVQQQMHPSEQVLAAFPASLFDHRRKEELRHDKFVLTTERIIYYHTSLMHKGMGEMPYRGITASQYSKGVRHGTVVIDAANASLTIRGISNDDAAFAAQIVSAIVGGRVLAPAPSK